MRHIIALLFTVLLAGQTQAQQFPTLQAEDLNERHVTLPADLPADPTIVFIAYQQNQQSDVNGWINGLELSEDGPIEFIELPVIGRGGRLMKSIIDNGMRSTITRPKMRARTITVYSSRTAFNRALGIKSRKQVYVAVVTRKGQILAMVSGPYTSAKAQHIRSAL